MEKVIESEIRISKVVNPVVDEVVISEVPVEDVQVQVSEPVVVDSVDPHVVVANVEQVQGEIR